MKNNMGFINFIFMVLTIIIILVVLRYRYDIDIVNEAFETGSELWQKYGGTVEKIIESKKIN